MSARALLFVAVAGALFGFGLALSTMVQPEVVIAFLLWRDMGLALVLGGAIAVTFVAYRWLPRWMGKPWTAETFGKHPSDLSSRTLAGAAIFGVGWGLCGVCPGPAIAGMGVGNWPLAFALAGLAAGAYVQGRFFPGGKP
ncbi:MAG: YeeE/YedE family protein [Burkholderiales bacterium]|nr:YeeE/YedE family protein [Burkholderiales bacterium]